MKMSLLVSGRGVDVEIVVEVEVVVTSVLAEDVEAGVTRHEQADETLLAKPPQLATKVGSARPVVAV